MKVASKAVCRMDLANTLDNHPSRESTKGGRGRQENTGTSLLPATQVILRPPWEHMGAKGKYVWACGKVYTGGFQAGLPHGRATLEIPGGWRYVGEFVEGKMHGEGTFTWSDGTSY